MNLLLDDDEDNNVGTIDISQNSEVPLSINLDSTRNTRKLELQSEQPSITLNSKSVLKGDLEIVVPEKVTYFVMNKIPLIGNGILAVKRKIPPTTRDTVSKKDNFVDIEINNVTIEKSTSAELSHMKIKGPLKIFQGSTVTFSNNVTLEETDITYILETLNNENDGIFGLDSEKTFKSVPKSINFQLPEDQFNISQPSALILIKEKEFDCKPWESIIALKNENVTKINNAATFLFRIIRLLKFLYFKLTLLDWKVFSKYNLRNAWL